MNNPRYGAARTYAFIGFIFYVLTAAAGIIGLLVFAFLFAATTTTSFPTTPPATTITFPFFGIFSFIFLIFLVPAAILTFFAWQTVKNIDAGRYNQARTYSLILGIIGLAFSMLIGGIFFLLAYAKLGEYPPPTQPQYTAQRFCVNCGRPVSPDATYCPHCGKKLPP